MIVTFDTAGSLNRPDRCVKQNEASAADALGVIDRNDTFEMSNLKTFIARGDAIERRERGVVFGGVVGDADRRCLRLCRGVVVGPNCPVGQSRSLAIWPASMAKPVSGKGKRSAGRSWWVTISLTRSATLIRHRRIVSSWASRQNDVRGARRRSLNSSQ